MASATRAKVPTFHWIDPKPRCASVSSVGWFYPCKLSFAFASQASPISRTTSQNTRRRRHLRLRLTSCFQEEPSENESSFVIFTLTCSRQCFGCDFRPERLGKHWSLPLHGSPSFLSIESTLATLCFRHSRCRSLALETVIVSADPNRSDTCLSALQWNANGRWANGVSFKERTLFIAHAELECHLGLFGDIADATFDFLQFLVRVIGITDVETSVNDQCGFDIGSDDFLFEDGGEFVSNVHQIDYGHVSTGAISLKKRKIRFEQRADRGERRFTIWPITESKQVVPEKRVSDYRCLKRAELWNYPFVSSIEVNRFAPSTLFIGCFRKIIGRLTFDGDYWHADAFFSGTFRH